VLAVFTLHVNQVLSRQDIIAQVRGAHWAVNPRMVDNVVSRLRRKMFEDGDGSERLRTVHGRGYMLVQLSQDAMAGPGRSD